MTEKFTIEDLSYIAGFIDGEGSFDILKLHPSPNNRRKFDFHIARSCVVNTNKEVLEKMQMLFGGRIEQRKQIINRKTCFQWVLHGPDLLNLCKCIFKYSIVKKEQIEILIEFFKTNDGRRHTVSVEKRQFREECYLKIRALKHI